MIMNKRIGFGIVIILLLLAQCKKRENPVNSEPIPIVPVNKTINLAIRGNFLFVPGTFFYETGGNKGLLVVHDFDDIIRVFDRTCSHQPSNACAMVTVDSSALQMRCGVYEPSGFINCCGSLFNFSGMPTRTPAIFPLLQYRTSRTGDLLSVYN